MGSSPKLEPDTVSTSSNSDDELDKQLKHLPRAESTGSDMGVKFGIGLEPEDVEYEINVKGNENKAFSFDEKDIKKYGQSGEQVYVYS